MAPTYKNEDLWGAALDAADLGTFYAEGPDFDHVVVSMSYGRHFNLTPGQSTLTKEEILSRIVEEDRTAVRAAREKATSSGVIYNAEYRLNAVDGRIIWINATGKVMTRPDGTQVFAGVTRDITRQKQAEVELSAHTNRDKRIAQTFQRVLLDLPPLDEGSHLRYEPFYEAYSTEEAAVGGDFLDVVAFSSDRAAFIVGDVQGHGLQAAAVALEARLALHAFLSAGDSGGLALSRLNNFAIDRNWASEYDVSFVCLTVCIIDRLAGTLDVSLAGGYPPVLFKHGGDAQVIEGHTCCPVGIASGASFSSLHVELPDICSIALFTDGLVELRNRNKEELQVDGVVKLLTGAKIHDDSIDLKAIGNRVLKGSKAYASRVTDDMCLLLVRNSCR